jgi:hypothetical protein
MYSHSCPYMNYSFGRTPFRKLRNFREKIATNGHSYKSSPLIATNCPRFPHGSVRAVCVAVCGSALGSVWHCGSGCVAMQQCMCGSAGVCGSARGCVRQCAQQCVAVRLVVHEITRGSVKLCGSEAVCCSAAVCSRVR